MMLKCSTPPTLVPAVITAPICDNLDNPLLPMHLLVVVTCQIPCKLDWFCRSNKTRVSSSVLFYHVFAYPVLVGIVFLFKLCCGLSMSWRAMIEAIELTSEKLQVLLASSCPLSCRLCWSNLLKRSNSLLILPPAEMQFSFPCCVWKPSAASRERQKVFWCWFEEKQVLRCRSGAPKWSSQKLRRRLNPPKLNISRKERQGFLQPAERKLTLHILQREQGLAYKQKVRNEAKRRQQSASASAVSDDRRQRVRWRQHQKRKKKKKRKASSGKPLEWKNESSKTRIQDYRHKACWRNWNQRYCATTACSNVARLDDCPFALYRSANACWKCLVRA